MRGRILKYLIVVALLLMGSVVAPPFGVPPTQAASIVLPEIVATRISYNSEKTRFIAELNFAVGYNVYVLTNPYRVIIDIPDAIFSLSPKAGTTGNGLIKGFRFGQLADDRSRIVIDVKGPVLIQNSYAVRAKGNRPARLIVDLIATDAKTFAKIHQVDQVANLVAKQEAKNKADIPTSKPLASKPLAKTHDKKTNDPIADLLNGKNPVTPPKPVRKKVTRQSPLKKGNKLLIVIDPGHGGIDTGASSKKGLTEKSLVLDFSKKLRTHLQAYGRYKVIMTRSGDKFVTLRDRVKIAHSNKADLFISIHADAIRHRLVRGTTLYTLSETASDEEAAQLAAKENRADIIGGVNLSDESEEITNILIDLAQRETKNHSVYFAKKALSRLKGVTRVAKRPLRSAGFVVLKAPDVPSVLLELGYLTNKHDARLLGNKAWQNKVAKALASSVDNYFRARVALQ